MAWDHTILVANVDRRNEKWRSQGTLCATTVLFRTVWQVAPSCWSHMSSTSVSSNWCQKICYHLPITFTTDCYCIITVMLKNYGPITPPTQNPHQTLIFCGCIGCSRMTRGFSSPQMRQFCFFTYPFTWKWASSLNIFFFSQNRHQLGGSLTPNQRSHDAVYDLLASIPGTIECCRHANADLYLKCAAWCCRKGPAAGNDGEWRSTDCHGH